MPTEYRLIKSNDTQSLNTHVNQLLDDGWVLHESPALVDTSNKVIYAQALTKTGGGGGGGP